MNDTMTAVGNVLVTKTDIETGKVVYEKWFKNQITNYARQQAASAWGQSVNQVSPTFPSMISVGTGSPSGGITGTTPNDTALWSEVDGSRVNVDYAQVWMQYYTQFSATYQQTQVLMPNINFSDAMTEYTGSTSSNWTLIAGSVTYGSNGVTLNSNNSNIQSNNAVGIDASTTQAITAQATFTIPSSSVSANFLRLYQDGNNYYTFLFNYNTIEITKMVGGTYSALTNGPVINWTAGASYTLTLSLDNNGNMTASIYNGTTATGTAIATVTVIDTSLPGPFSLQIGGDANVVVSNFQAVYPNNDPVQTINLTEAGLWDNQGNLFSHVALTGVTHDNTSTLSIQWQVLQQGN